MGEYWPRPKGMRQATHQRLLNRLYDCEERRDTAFCVRVAQLFGSMKQFQKWAGSRVQPMLPRFSEVRARVRIGQGSPICEHFPTVRQIIARGKPEGFNGSIYRGIERKAGEQTGEQKLV